MVTDVRDTVYEDADLSSAPCRAHPGQRLAGFLWRAGSGWHTFAALAFVFGLVVRLRQFFWDRSLWVDEASVTLNILHRSPSHLLKPLALFQAAPAGWLLAEKSAVNVFGTGEQALRLVSLVSGMLVLVLAWDIARRSFGPSVAGLVMLLVAVSPALIRYSNEVKQYSSDVASVLIIVDIGIILLAYGHKRVPVAKAILFGLLAGGACFFSQPAVMVSVLLVPIVVRSAWLSRRPESAGIIAALWVSGVVLQYVTTIRYLADSTAHRLAVRWFYPPLWPKTVSPFGRARWLPGGIIRLFHDPFAAPVSLLIVVATVVGVVACLGTRRWVLLALGGPFVLSCFAVLDYKYPLGGRFSLYLLPLVLILCCAPLAQLKSAVRSGGTVWWRGGAALVAFVFVASMLISQLPKAVGYAVTPQTVTELRPVLEQLRSQLSPGEAVIPFTGTDQPYVYYAQRFGGLPTDGRSISDFPGSCPDEGVINTLRRHGRFWFVYTTLDSSVAPGELHAGDPSTKEDVDRTLARVTAYGKIIGRISGDRAGAVEIVMNGAPYRQPPADTSCLVQWPLSTHV